MGSKIYVFGGADTIEVLDLEGELVWQSVRVPSLSKLDLSNAIVVKQAADKMLIIGEDKANNQVRSVQLLDLARMESHEISTCKQVSLKSLGSPAAQVVGNSDMVALV